MTINYLIKNYINTDDFLLANIEKCYVCGKYFGFVKWKHKDNDKDNVVMCYNCNKKALDNIELQKLRIEKIKRLKNDN